MVGLALGGEKMTQGLGGAQSWDSGDCGREDQGAPEGRGLAREQLRASGKGRRCHWPFVATNLDFSALPPTLERTPLVLCPKTTIP